MQRWLAVLGVPALLAIACGDGGGTSPGEGSAPASASLAAPLPPLAPESLSPIALTGNALAAAADDRSLIVADEDHEVLYVVPTAVDAPDGVVVLPMPGPPAQVVDAGDAVFVTIRSVPTPEAKAVRDRIKGPTPTREAMSAAVMVTPKPPTSASAPAPSEKPKGAPARSAMPSASAAPSAKPSASAGPVKPPPKKERGTKPLMFDPLVAQKSSGGLLLVLARDAQGGLSERARLSLPLDAWGIALTPDGKRALVTSAWAAKLSVVDVSLRAEPRIVATLDSAREPRGVAIKADGKTAYVSHLVGTALTRVDSLDGTPKAAVVELPAAISRTPVGARVEASLGYSVLISSDQRTLFAPRHALGAEGIGSWWGTPVVDTLDLPSEKPFAPRRQLRSPTSKMAEHESGLFAPPDWGAVAGLAPAPNRHLVQPRAAVLAKKRNTIFVAGEGYDSVAELDARLPDPAMRPVRSWSVGGDYDVYGGYAGYGGAPTGLALARDESVLYVYCRSTFDVVRIDLGSGATRRVRVAEDGLPVDAAYGRRLYYNARNTVVSGGLGCAGCHPDGRDDGYVWREGTLAASYNMQRRFVASRALLKPNAAFMSEHVDPAKVELYARQTPIIAGRTRASGPYAWHAEDKDLLERLNSGFSLHRGGWDGINDVREAGQDVAKVDYLADFLRSGLMPPPALARELTDVEKQGKEIFVSAKAACASCHVPERELTDRATHTLAATGRSPDFSEENGNAFRTPSLFFLSGSAPYFHDGSSPSLEDLVEKNGTRMGSTAHLSADEKTALVAYLRTL